MNIKNLSRLRRAKKTRFAIKDQETPRLTVFRSSKHFYAQVFDSLGSKVLVSASTLENDNSSKSNNILAAKEVGKKIAERAIENGIKKVREFSVKNFTVSKMSFRKSIERNKKIIQSIICRPTELIKSVFS